MAVKLKILQVALQRQDYNLAAHVLVYGLVKTKVEELSTNGQKERRSKGQPERP